MYWEHVSAKNAIGVIPREGVESYVPALVGYELEVIPREGVERSMTYYTFEVGYDPGL